MGVIEFIIELTKSLAWPIVTLVIVLLMKKEIQGLFRELKSFKIKGTEFNFDKEVKNVKLEASELMLAKDKELIVQDNINNKERTFLKRIELAELSPRGAVLEAWLELEEIILESGEKFEYGCTAAPSNINKLSKHRDIMKDLFERQMLSAYDYKLYDGLRKVRNESVHLKDKQLSNSGSIEFITMAEKLKKKLKGLK